MKNILRQLKQYKRDTFLCIGLTALEVIMEILMPFITAMIIDKGLEVGNLPVVYRYGAVMVLMAFLSLIFGALAGKNAAQYVKERYGKDVKKSDNVIDIKATDGARYTVPTSIHLDNMADLLTVRFRVGSVFKDSYISVYFNDERVQHRKKQVMAPGEMEQIILKKKALEDYDGLKTITVKIEEE